jgi:hypothetical protein
VVPMTRFYTKGEFWHSSITTDLRERVVRGEVLSNISKDANLVAAATELTKKGRLLHDCVSDGSRVFTLLDHGPRRRSERQRPVPWSVPCVGRSIRWRILFLATLSSPGTVPSSKSHIKFGKSQSHALTY